MRRLTILLAAMGALLLLPAAQAFASGTLTVGFEGAGSGEISSVGGISGSGAYEGSPPIECTGPPATGTCETELYEDPEEPGLSAIGLHAVAGPGSKFAGWLVEEGEHLPFDCTAAGSCVPYTEGTGNAIVIAIFEPAPQFSLTVSKTGTGSGTVTSSPAGINCGGTCSAKFNEGQIVTLTPKEAKGSKFIGWSDPACPGDGICKLTMSKAREVSANFDLTAPSGPINLRTLTVTKSPSSSTGGGNGSVSSKPKGIKCGATCDEAVARMYKETSVELVAKPSTGSTFVEWEGGDCDESKSTTCTIGLDKDEATEAVFGGASKAFSPAEELVVSKGSSTGKGTVKAAGLGCEAECSSTTVLYQGPITEPKAKAGKVVILKQAPAFGSKFSGWSGCDSVTEAGECVVAMETDKTVKAEYAALPNKTLTVNKSYAKGNGSVASKPKGIKCATTCTQAAAQMPEGAAVELVAKPSSGTFVKWEGGDCNGSTSTTCVIGMDKDETTTAVFSDPGKAITPAQTLTLNKAGSGYGTVKASGLTCEVLCSSTTALYQGPITEPKAKAGKVVILKAASAPGSKAVAWTGCDSNPTPGECVVAMEANKTVTATFNELE